MTKFGTALLVVLACSFLNPAAVRAQPTPRPWSLQLGTGVSYDSNALLSAPEAVGDVATNFNINLSRSVIYTGRGNLNLSGNAVQYLYLSSEAPDQFTYGINASGAYAFTRRLNWSINTSITAGYAKDNTLLTEDGVVLPFVVTRSQVVSTSLTYALSRKSSIGVTAGFQSAGFDALTFKDGANMTANVTLSRQLTETQTMGVTTGYSHAFADSRAGEIQALVATWQMTKGRGAFTASGGLQPYTVPDEGYKVNPTYSVGWNMAFNRTHSVAASYSRLAQYAFGLDRTNVTEGVLGSYQLAFRRVTTALNGNYTRGTDTVGDGVLNGGTLVITVAVRVFRDLSVNWGTSLYSSNPSTYTYRSMFSLSYGTSF